MIIISRQYNQLCNRLFSYLPTFSYALEYGESIVFFFQYKLYDHLFPNLSTYRAGSYFTSSKISGNVFIRIFNGIIKLLRWTHGSNSKTSLKKFLGITFSPGWSNSSDRAFIDKHADTLRFLFSPHEAVWKQAEALVEPDRKYVMVGVHIRRGDYATYRGGKYYFDLEVYANYMLKLKEQIISNSAIGEKVQVRFLLCSNERISMKKFAGLDVVIGNGDFIVDLYSLSLCDYIIGVPSTFSQWASFYGKVPLGIITSSDACVSLKDFSIIDYIDHFVNGTEIVWN
ncbi:alpha-1,2-fucosyltransferase [Bacteroides sp.]